MSIFKLHQAIAILKKIEQSEMRLSDKIFIKQTDLLPDTYSPLRDSYPMGNIQLSIMELLSYSLQLSDNNACDILYDKIIDPIGTDQTIRAFGIESFMISQNEADMHRNLENCYSNWSTPLAVAELIEKVLAGKILSYDHVAVLKEMLIECKTGVDRIPKYLPSDGIVLGHKNGTGDRNSKQEIIGLNDAGFVILPNGKRYVLTVLIKIHVFHMKKLPKS